MGGKCGGSEVELALPVFALRVPYADRVVLGARYEVVAAGVDSQGGDAALVALKVPDERVVVRGKVSYIICGKRRAWSAIPPPSPNPSLSSRPPMHGGKRTILLGARVYDA